MGVCKIGRLFGVFTLLLLLAPFACAVWMSFAPGEVLEPPSDDVLAIHEALGELEERDPLKAQIVLLRYFTGLTMDETAAILGLAERTLDRHWRYIRAWLMKRLS